MRVRGCDDQLRVGVAPVASDNLFAPAEVVGGNYVLRLPVECFEAAIPEFALVACRCRRPRVNLAAGSR